MKYRIRYYLGKFCKLLGFCRDCQGKLNYLPGGYAVCSDCRKRF